MTAAAGAALAVTDRREADHGATDRAVPGRREAGHGSKGRLGADHARTARDTMGPATTARDRPAPGRADRDSMAPGPSKVVPRVRVGHRTAGGRRVRDQTVVARVGRRMRGVPRLLARTVVVRGRGRGRTNSRTTVTQRQAANHGSPTSGRPVRVETSAIDRVRASARVIARATDRVPAARPPDVRSGDHPAAGATRIGRFGRGRAVTARTVVRRSMLAAAGPPVRPRCHPRRRSAPTRSS